MRTVRGPYRHAGWEFLLWGACMRYFLLTVGTAALVLSLAAPAAAWHWPWTRPQPATKTAGDSAYLAPPPRAGFYPQAVPGPYPPYSRIAPTPTFDYGYFGAYSNPGYYQHNGYYGATSDWFTPSR